jgi:hypothetical protein
MDYQRIYNELIIKRTMSPLPKDEYGELHHIVPRCMNGSDDATNLIRLTPEEHVIAHLLLVKIYPYESKLVYAANWMTNRVNNNKQYGWLKREFSKIEKLTKTGKPRSQASINKQKNTITEKYKNGYTYPQGRKLTDEHKAAISQANQGKTIALSARSSLEGYILRYGERQGREKYLLNNKKKDRASLDYFILKYGEQQGREKYLLRCENLSNKIRGENNPFSGKTHTAENRAKIAANTSKHQLGRPKPRRPCEHCGKDYAVNAMPHHIKKCLKTVI